jgi:hypothetical protein
MKRKREHTHVPYRAVICLDTLGVVHSFFTPNELRISVRVDTMVGIENARFAKDGGGARMGWLKLPRIGAGFFAHRRTSNGRRADPGNVVSRCLDDAVEFVLRTPDDFPNIHTIEMLRFDVHGRSSKTTRGRGLLSPDASAAIAKKERSVALLQVLSRSGARRVTLEYTNGGLLDIPEWQASTYRVGILNAGDAYSLVGNEMHYGSLEAMIGNDTSMRVDQVYLYNKHLLSTPSGTCRSRSRTAQTCTRARAARVCRMRHRAVQRTPPPPPTTTTTTTHPPRRWTSFVTRTRRSGTISSTSACPTTTDHTRAHVRKGRKGRNE